MRRPLLISHDLSHSGAPLALLALAQALKRLGENPLVVALAGGPLGAKFREAGIELGQSVDPADIAFVIGNTVLSVPMAVRFKRFGIPVAAWLHEAAYFFEITRLSPRECELPQLDFVLLPAKAQARELGPFLPAEAAYQLRCSVRQAWFRPPGDETTLAVCGKWEARKGQTRLLELARDVAQPPRFKFIGAVRPPELPAEGPADAGHAFLGSLAPETATLEIARSAALVSCAEGEVQPLSVIEAALAGRPVLLSDIDAHRELAGLIPGAFLFDRGSSRSFGEGLAKLRESIPDAAAGARTRAAALALFGEAAFDRRVRDIVRILRREPGAAANVPRFQDP